VGWAWRKIFQNRKAECGVDPAQSQAECSHVVSCTGRNAREFSKSQGGLWGGPSPVSTEMPTTGFNLQDGMPANFQNRNVPERAKPPTRNACDFSKSGNTSRQRCRTFLSSTLRFICVLRDNIDATSILYGKIRIGDDVVFF